LDQARDKAREARQAAYDRNRPAPDVDSTFEEGHSVPVTSTPVVHQAHVLQEEVHLENTLGTAASAVTLQDHFLSATSGFRLSEETSQDSEEALARGDIEIEVLSQQLRYEPLENSEDLDSASVVATERTVAANENMSLPGGGARGGPNLNRGGRSLPAEEATVAYLNAKFKNEFKDLGPDSRKELHAAGVKMDLAFQRFDSHLQEMDKLLQEPYQRVSDGERATAAQLMACERAAKMGEKLVSEMEKRVEDVLALLNMIKDQLPHPVTVTDEIRAMMLTSSGEWNDRFRDFQAVQYSTERAEKADEASKAALSKIELKGFDGNLKDYLDFHDELQSLLLKKELPDSDKTARVLGCLRGKAARAFRGFTSSGGLNELLTRIKDRYGDVKILRTLYKDELRDYIPLSNDASFAEVRARMDAIDHTIRCLVKLNYPITKMVVEEEIIPLLPKYITMEITRRNPNLPDTYEDFVREAKGIIADLSRTRCLDNRRGGNTTKPAAAAAAVKSSDKEKPAKGQKKEQPKSDVKHVNAAAATGARPKQQQQGKKPGQQQRSPGKGKQQQQQQQKPKKETCSICKGSHPPDTCGELHSATVDERYALLKSKRLCFRCFMEGCRGKGRCSRKDARCHMRLEDGSHCTAKHSPLLHREQSSQA